MSVPIRITTTINQAPTGFVPATFQELLNAVAQYIVLSVQDSGIDIVFSATPSSIPPASVLPTTILAQIDTKGRPLGFWSIYNGVWHPFYNGNTVGMLTWFNGNQSTFFDASGNGLVNTPWYGWKIPASLYSHFLVPGYRNDGGGSVANFTAPPALAVSGLLATVAVAGDAYSGGLPYVGIAPGNLPALHINLFSSAGYAPYNIHKWNETIYGFDTNAAFPLPFTRYLTGNSGLDQATLLMPPFKSMAAVEFVGYA
jgi:hypothetical protein